MLPFLNLYFGCDQFLAEKNMFSQIVLSQKDKNAFQLGHIAGHTWNRLGLFSSHEGEFLFREHPSRQQPPTLIPLTKELFDDLWPLTQGHRIQWEYYPIENLPFLSGWVHFLGEHDSLEMVLLSSSNEEEVRQAHPWLQEKVSQRHEYQLLSLASFGVPHPFTPYQVGVMPYQIKEGEIYSLMITDSSGERWIFPKGNQEPDLAPDQVAMMEAMEEAGVLGIFRHDLHTTYQTKRGYPVRLYPLQISRILSKWPEKEKRVRRLVTLSQMRAMIANPSLLQAVESLSAQL